MRSRVRTQWFSVTKSWDVIKKWRQPGQWVAIIDGDKAEARLVDLATAENRARYLRGWSANTNGAIITRGPGREINKPERHTWKIVEMRNDPVDEEVVSPLSDAADGFIVPLHLNDGFDQLALDELCRQVDRLGQQWRTAEVFPKSAALLLSELYPAISACADLYAGDERQRMIDAAVRVGERLAFALDPAGEPEM